MQVHPDARSYKTKAVLNFNDLCVIYGYTSADGRYSRSSHDFDFDDEVQGVNMGVYLCFAFPMNLNLNFYSITPFNILIVTWILNKVDYNQ